MVKVDEWGEITCICMNEPSYDGFEVCYSNGQTDDNLLAKWNSDPVFYRCMRCNSIISEDTLEVVGVYSPSESVNVEEPF